MIATPAFLVLPGDHIRHRGENFTVTGASAVTDEANPRVYLTVASRDGRRYRLNLAQSDYVARLEGSLS